MAERWDAGGMLPVNTSDDATSYRTFAKLEVDDDENPIRDLVNRILAGQAQSTGRPNTDQELLAEVAITTALQFGWGAFEAEILGALEEFGAEQDSLRRRVAELSLRLQDDS